MQNSFLGWACIVAGLCFTIPENWQKGLLIAVFGLIWLTFGTSEKGQSKKNQTEDTEMD